MKALILVGGFGTRLRPLTFTKPKPLVDFANQPMIFHQIAALAEIGVKDIVLAVNYQPKTMVDAMHEVEARYNVKIHFSIESEPLGTAGPLALARDILAKDDDPFFVLNSDVICEFPFKSMLAFHQSHGAEGTLMTTPVEDPSKYGVIQLKEGTTEIARFHEKPKTFVGDQINAGIYIFNPTVLARIKPVPTSIEQEIFPVMAEEGQLHATPLAGFWADVGQPKDFLSGQAMYLNSLASKSPEVLSTGESISGNALVHPTAKLGEGCLIGPNVVIGQDVTVEAGARLANCNVMEGSHIKKNAYVKDSIVGWHSTVGAWARLEGMCVLGEDVQVGAEVFLRGTVILPHKSCKASLYEPRIVM